MENGVPDLVELMQKQKIPYSLIKGFNLLSASEKDIEDKKQYGISFFEASEIISAYTLRNSFPDTFK